ncbi:GNAT family N-acetyltransferase [Foetidibacter luteolus]|uniref:GNAT family N-acetyltransferase n=1 Tax=Foetidibacter luteolus TaxID=2608880 RepID=UPI00129B337C|nr:GNAT family N-acetyltransferase [Foetidibacter luteolus]
MNIRSATVNDIPVIRQIAYATWPVAYGSILSAEQLDYMLDLIYSTSSLEEQFAHHHHFYIAEQGNEPIGFASCNVVEPQKRWKLQKLYVLPDIQKSGAGKALLEKVIETAKAHLATELILNVNRNNPACSYYRKKGFDIVETVDVAIGSGFYMNDYVMRKRL